MSYEPPHGAVIVVPQTGEMIDLSDTPLCLRVLAEIRELESRLKEAKNELTGALAAEFSRQGTKTIVIEGRKAELKGGSEVVWDVEVLEELRDAGLPEDRMAQLITTEVTYKVNANVAKQLASANDDYAEIIGRARRVVPKAHYVTITHTKP